MNAAHLITQSYQRNGRNYCPIFDNGAGLLSNTQMLGMDIDPKGLLPAVQARPFNTTFNRQRNTAQGLYGQHLRMSRLDRGHILSVLEPLLEYYPERDRGLIADRVCTVILTRQRMM